MAGLTYEPVEMIPLAERPSYLSRLALLSMSGTAVNVRLDVGDPELEAVAEWWTARARRQFRQALWADDARAVGLVGTSIYRHIVPADGQPCRCCGEVAA